MTWNTYDKINFIKKVWKSFGVTKDYFVLKYKNPEIFVSFEKIYFVENPSREAMEKIGNRILTDLKTSNGVKSIEEGFEFELIESHINYSIQEKEIDVPSNKQNIVTLKTDTKLYYPFRQKIILNKMQNDFYKISEIISGAYNFNKSNEIIKIELSIEGIKPDIKYKEVTNDSEIIYKNKRLQINTSSRGENHPLIIGAIILLYLRFPEMKFVNKSN